MAKDETNRTANVNKLVWPQDKDGFLTKLKSAGTASARRIGGDKEKLQKYRAALRVLADYAAAVCERDAARKETVKANAVSARVRLTERRAKIASARVKDLENQIEAIISREDTQVPETE